MAQQVQQASEKMRDFQGSQSMDDLRAAVEAMEGVNLSGVTSERLQARLLATTAWLNILATIDTSLDPQFNPNDVPATSLIPPPTSTGVQFSSGTDPKAIPDPAVRAEYEEALKKNREKADQYRFQTTLQRLDARVSADVERFLKFHYTPTEADQNELDKLLSQVPISEPRKQRLKHLFKHNP